MVPLIEHHWAIAIAVLWLPCGWLTASVIAACGSLPQSDPKMVAAMAIVAWPIFAFCGLVVALSGVAMWSLAPARFIHAIATMHKCDRCGEKWNIGGYCSRCGKQIER